MKNENEMNRDDFLILFLIILPLAGTIGLTSTLPFPLPCRYCRCSIIHHEAPVDPVLFSKTSQISLDCVSF